MNSLTVGSLQAIAAQSNQSLAEVFVNVTCVVILDCSGSMSTCDSKNGMSRFERATQELNYLQEQRPGQIAIIGFSDAVNFFPGGIVRYLGGGTNLANALDFARTMEAPKIDFIVISDGEPNNEEAAMCAARKFNNTIHTIYCGPEERPRGRDFLMRLARASGGHSITVDRAMELAAGVTALLYLQEKL